MNKNLIEIIKQLVMRTTNGLKANLLGPKYVHKEFLFSLKNFNPSTTLAHTYLNANSMNSSDAKSIDEKTLSTIENNALNHINSFEEKTHTDLTRMVTDYQHNMEVKAKMAGKSVEEIKSTDEGIKASKELSHNVNNYLKKMNTSVETITENELHVAANFGAFDGIIHTAKSMGISDPTVCKLGVNDNKKCKHCKRLWMSDDGITPRVYKLSELAGAAGDWKNPVASISTTHPSCRDILTLISPGFGFEGGKIAYKGKDPSTNQPWDEYSKQRKS